MKKMINSSPSDSYEITLLFLLEEKHYPKQTHTHLIRKRKTKEIQEKKGKQKKSR